MDARTSAYREYFAALTANGYPANKVAALLLPLLSSGDPAAIAADAERQLLAQALSQQQQSKACPTAAPALVPSDLLGNLASSAVPNTEPSDTALSTPSPPPGSFVSLYREAAAARAALQSAIAHADAGKGAPENAVSYKLFSATRHGRKEVRNFTVPVAYNGLLRNVMMLFGSRGALASAFLLPPPTEQSANGDSTPFVGAVANPFMSGGGAGSGRGPAGSPVDLPALDGGSAAGASGAAAASPSHAGTVHGSAGGVGAGHRDGSGGDSAAAAGAEGDVEMGGSAAGTGAGGSAPPGARSRSGSDVEMVGASAATATAASGKPARGGAGAGSDSDSDGSDRDEPPPLLSSGVSQPAPAPATSAQPAAAVSPQPASVSAPVSARPRAPPASYVPPCPVNVAEVLATYDLILEAASEEGAPAAANLRLALAAALSSAIDRIASQVSDWARGGSSRATLTLLQNDPSHLAPLLIAALCPLLEDPAYHASAAFPLCRVVEKLPAEARALLHAWLAGAGADIKRSALRAGQAGAAAASASMGGVGAPSDDGTGSSGVGGSLEVDHDASGAVAKPSVAPGACDCARRAGASATSEALVAAAAAALAASPPASPSDVPAAVAAVEAQGVLPPLVSSFTLRAAARLASCGALSATRDGASSPAPSSLRDSAVLLLASAAADASVRLCRLGAHAPSDLAPLAIRRCIDWAQQLITVKIYERTMVQEGDDADDEDAARRRGLTLDEISPPVTWLSVLNAANEAHLASHRCRAVPFASLYNEVISSEINLGDDFARWAAARAAGAGAGAGSASASAARRMFSFCGHAFILDAGAKAVVLQHESQEQQSQSASIAMLSALFGGAGGAGAASPYFHLRVDRSNLVEGAMNAITNVPNRGALKRPLRVEFRGEEGVDAGGVKKEFFALLSRKLLSPSFGMFTEEPSSATLWFSPDAFDAGATALQFELVGSLLGLALYNSVILDVRFPLALWRKLKGEPPSLRDLDDWQPAVAKGLRALLAYPGDDFEDVFSLNWTATRESWGAPVTVDLVPGGTDKPVTRLNRRDYVRAYVKWLLSDSIAPQFAPFARGFNNVAGGPALDLFRPEELALCVTGSSVLDFKALQEGASYEEPYSASHPVVAWLWDTVHSFSPEEQRQFLAFSTGSDRSPIRGLGSLNFIVMRSGPDSNNLPCASTCFNTLQLPEYATREKLAAKLRAAIKESEGFGLR